MTFIQTGKFKQILASFVPITFNTKKHVGEDLNQITNIFENMEADGWDLSQKMFWSYYFTSSSESHLLKLKKQLIKSSKLKIEIHKDRAQPLLEAYEYKVHTPATLIERNKNFFDLVRENRFVTYDGWEVSKKRSE